MPTVQTTPELQYYGALSAKYQLNKY
ncbi:CG34223 [Drosophila busckii]|uniref:CG34223 n=1 Tax=Drosophila busckii TaxID=30019 RepID=A0A0M4EJL3_DROBS|nr:CG34223 [Drosophila busckii]